MLNRFSRPVIPVLLSSILALSLVGCGKGASSTPAASSPQQQPAASSAVSSVPAPPETTYPSEFDIGDTLIFPAQYEITLQNLTFAKRVDPPNPTTFFSYYEAKDPSSIMVDIVVQVKNLGGNSLNADEILSSKLLYDEKYEYPCHSVIETSGGSDFTYTNITSIPCLTTATLHFLAEVPLEVRDSEKKVSVSFNVHGTKLTCTGETGEAKPLLMQAETEVPDNTSWQPATEVAVGTVFTIEDYGEFTLKNTMMDQVIKPSNPTGFYTYYESHDPNVIYFDAVVSFKNLMSSEKGADDVASVQLIYGGKYLYHGSVYPEDADGSNFGFSNLTDIAPLSTCTLHYLFKIPQEIKDSDQSLAVVISTNQGRYYIPVR